MKYLATMASFQKYILNLVSEKERTGAESMGTVIYADNGDVAPFLDDLEEALEDQAMTTLRIDIKEIFSEGQDSVKHVNAAYEALRRMRKRYFYRVLLIDNFDAELDDIKRIQCSQILMKCYIAGIDTIVTTDKPVGALVGVSKYIIHLENSGDEKQASLTRLNTRKEIVRWEENVDESIN